MKFFWSAMLVLLISFLAPVGSAGSVIDPTARPARTDSCVVDIFICFDSDGNCYTVRPFRDNSFGTVTYECNFGDAWCLILGCVCYWGDCPSISGGRCEISAGPTYEPNTMVGVLCSSEDQAEFSRGVLLVQRHEETPAAAKRDDECLVLWFICFSQSNENGWSCTRIAVVDGNDFLVVDVFCNFPGGGGAFCTVGGIGCYCVDLGNCPGLNGASGCLVAAGPIYSFMVGVFCAETAPAGIEPPSPRSSENVAVAPAGILKSADRSAGSTAG